MSLPPASLHITLPEWIDGWIGERTHWTTDIDRMRLAIGLSRENVLRGTGGPFGAAIFEGQTGRLVAVGVNSVLRLASSSLHAEMMAFMMAQARLGSFTLGAPGMPPHELFTSCEPCAMCLGGTLWSGVRRIVCGAARDDATQLAFDEGPVFPASWQYLADRGVAIVRNVVRDEARTVLELYRQQKGEIYNG